MCAHISLCIYIYIHTQIDRHTYIYIYRERERDRWIDIIHPRIGWRRRLRLPRRRPCRARHPAGAEVTVTK